MLQVKTLQVGSLKTNCYLVYSSDNLIIIDPGDDPYYIANNIQDLDIKPSKILATHGHYDHLMAAMELKLAFKIPLYMNFKDKVLLKWYRKSARHFEAEDPGPAPDVDKNLTEKTSLKIGNTNIKIIFTPGHTPGGVCIYPEGEGIVFTGDTIFADGYVGRTDFPYCNRDDLEKSIDKLVSLPKETIVYPGHGRETTIGEFMLQWRHNE